MSLLPASNNLRRTIGIGEFTLTKADSSTITTHALGSCIGVTIFDPVARVGGMLHYLLPQPSRREKVEPSRLGIYATTGLPELFKQAYSLGASKNNLIVCVAGAATLLADTSGFQIGKRNRAMLRKLFWKNNIPIAAEETGGTIARTLHLELTSGVVTVQSKGKENILWHP